MQSRFLYKPVTFLLLPVAIFLFSILNCKEKRPFLDDPDGPSIVEETLVAKDPLLKLLPNEQTGIDFQNSILETDENNFYTNINIYNGGGVSAADFNNDGLQDLYFVSSNGKNKLYLNKGNFKFEDATDNAGISSEEGFETTSTAVDINNDGWMDIYVCRAGMKAGDTRRNKLFVNNGLSENGKVSFTESAKRYGIDDASASTGANFFDFDGDGDLDLYLLNQPSSGEYTNKLESKVGPDGKTMVANLDPKADYDSDQFYRNDGPPQADGKGGFTNISKAAGIWNLGYGLSVSVSDLNYDGRPDVYVANDFIHPDFFYINNGNGTFTDKLKSYFRHTSRHTMGSDLTDFDNDGLVDLYTVDMFPITNYRLKTTRVTMAQSAYTSAVQAGYYEPVVRNVLQRNNGNGSFSDVGCLANVHRTDWSWSNLLFDIDNDGFRDLHVANGYRRNLNDNDFFEYKFDEISKLVDPNNLKAYFNDIHEFLRLIPTYKSRNLCYKNNGDWTFSDKSGDWMTMPASWSNGAVWADLDNDGDLDLVVNNLEDQPFVYQNLASDQHKNNYLQIKLKGSEKNTFAIGASALIEYGGQIQYLELNPVRGIFSSVEYLLHFGLAKASQVDKLVVRWPDGKTQTLTNIPANQRLQLNYSDASGYVTHLLPPQPKALYFQEKTAGSRPAFVHTENAFNDFEAWPLNLLKETDLGPQIAVGDVNGDGFDDFFIGNSFDQPAALYIQSANGGFQPVSKTTWESDKIYEDHGAVFFDADGDGDQDLYAISGGMEATSPLAWEDRLYLNDGKGNFSKAAGAIPAIQSVGFSVVAADLDMDNDLDLVVGGRVLGAQWPLTPQSFILQNDGRGHFTDVTSKLAPDFERCGMVTDICVANIDGTPTPEIILCGEWMPITVFRFTGNKWEKAASEQLGFAKSNGLWDSMLCADLDGDGDLDLVTGNIGLNTRLTASNDAPLCLFAGDYDHNGTLDPIVTCRENGLDFPLIQKMVMHRHIPSTKKKFLLAEDYSKAPIEKIFGEDALNKGLKLEAFTLETCWWENQNGKFVKRTFPKPAQIAPVNAICFADFTGDGKPDLLMAGNKYGLEVETNRLDSGNGTLLQGDGQGNFNYIENHQSGFWATHEVRDLAILRRAGVPKTIVVANNNAPVQVFEVKNSAKLQ